MRKKDKLVRHQRARERKELKRKKTRGAHKVSRSWLKSQLKRTWIQKRKGFSRFSKHMKNHLYSENKILNHIEAPSTLSFDTHCEDTMDYLSKLYSSLHNACQNNNNTINLSFEKCKDLELTPLVLVKVIVNDFFRWKNKAKDRGIPESMLPDLALNPKRSQKINNLLLSIDFPATKNFDEDFIKLRFSLLVGRINPKSFKKNNKGLIITLLKIYINECLRENGVELSINGHREFGQMFGEILANADDHSSIDEWYVHGSYSVNNINNESQTGRLRLVFVNMGYSIAEGFLRNQMHIQQTFSKMKLLYENAIDSEEKKVKFPFETMLTLYALQDGNSRLLHNDISRGTGTMTMIKSFLSLGDDLKDSKSEMRILSGNTLLLCNRNYLPFEVENYSYLTLNHEQSLLVVPDSKNLKTLPINFPGTIITTNIFLNKESLTKIVLDNETN